MVKFSIGDVLSITTGRLVSREGMDGVYKILSYMSGENLMTHQLPRVFRECKPVLLEQYPQLGEIDASGVNKDNLEVWLAEQANKYSEELEVTPLLKTQHKQHPWDDEFRKRGGQKKMKLEITVEDTTEQAQRIILRDIKSIIEDYRTQERLKRLLKVKEVGK